ncbi:hypothetical protein POV27_08000 [Aureisphaera galaxeae]|uniref:hypothetical protein n=1 Tax=Aureisphaera galaxeae TaxID=1538023 RepID=UPI002350090F|nr:hypothetical protein [Aureisphaera galaxeae]MDC8003991.1 hypothetical protein [Aureisphaera galaxeae]
MKNVFHLVLFSLLVVSCTSESKLDNGESKAPDQLNLSDRSCGSFSIEEINLIGEKHNEYVIDWLQQLDCNSPDFMEDAMATYRSLGKGEFNDNHIKEMTNDPRVTFAAEDYAQQFNNPATVGYYNQLMNLIDQSNDYASFVAGLTALQSQVDSNLDCFDWSFMMTSISVARKSAQLWTPVAAGGMGLAPCGTTGFSRIPWWKKAVRNDIAGAAGYFMAVGVGLTVPGANVAIAGSVAFAAGWSSAVGSLWD